VCNTYEKKIILEGRFENFLRRVDEDPEFPSRVIFNDELLFIQKEIFNSYNARVE